MNLTRGENRRGNWVGGRVISSGGYIQTRCEGHPRATKNGHYVFEHILVMEKSLGRLLNPKEVVHHKNHIKTDNRIENLELLDAREHHKKHPPVNPFKKGVIHSAEHNRKVSEAKKRWWVEKKKNGK